VGDDVALAGGGADRESGGAVVLQGVVDAAVGRAGVQGSRDAGGRADRDAAGLGGQRDQAGGGFADADVAAGGADFGRSAEAADLDVAVGGGEVDARGFGELDVAVRAGEGDLAEAAGAVEFGAGGGGLDAGPGGEPDGDFDRARRAEVLVPALRGVDPQDAVGLADGGLPGGLDVAVLAGVGGADLDGGVGAVGREEPDAAGGEVEGGGDRGGGGEGRHLFSCGRWPPVVGTGTTVAGRADTRRPPR
jgi:hypothetical protein